MKSFRGERQKQHASVQVILALLVLLTSILLVNYLPTDADGNDWQGQNTKWESSIIKHP